jgi:hypothetical protein
MNKKILALVALTAFSGAMLDAACTSCNRNKEQPRRRVVKPVVKQAPKPTCTTCPRNR